jgi:hypothetical protein
MSLLALLLPRLLGKISEEQANSSIMKLLDCSKYFEHVDYAPKIMILGLTELL